MSTLVREKAIKEIKAVLEQYKSVEQSVKYKTVATTKEVTLPAKSNLQSQLNKIIYNHDVSRKIATIERLKRRF